MPQSNRYIIWRGIADPEIDELLRRADEDDIEITRTDDFVVVNATEEDILAVFGPYLRDNQILAPEGATILGEIELTGQFLVGIDAPIDFAEYNGRRNVSPGPASFDRDSAENLIAASEIRNFAASGTRRVNVVIVDGGLDESYLNSIGYTKPLETLPGITGSHVAPHARQSQRHANAVARSIFSIAPDVHFVDAPILPDRIDYVDLFASRVIQLIAALLGEINGRSDESWVVVCAWGLLDRKYDRFLGTYADNHNHMLSTVIKHLVTKGVDVVFSAGNSGLFSPDFRSGHTDRGPYGSIMGSNGLPSVLTVGGVNAIERWIGESSQGPEPPDLRFVGIKAPRKPDVCAPTWFCENYDRHAALTGTSGACAVAAGVVAAVRRKKSPASLSPSDLIDRIRDTARVIGYTKRDDRSTPAEWRIGSGIVDCAELVKVL